MVFHIETQVNLDILSRKSLSSFPESPHQPSTSRKQSSTTVLKHQRKRSFAAKRFTELMNLDSMNAAAESSTSTAALFEEIPLYDEGF